MLASESSSFGSDEHPGPEVSVRDRNKKKWLKVAGAVIAVVLVIIIIAVAVAASRNGSGSPDPSPLPSDPLQRARALQAMYPLIDGHNDLPWELRKSVILTPYQCIPSAHVRSVDSSPLDVLLMVRCDQIC